MEKRVDSRKKQFKKNFDDPRRKREELQVVLRKKDREEELKKKRQQLSGNQVDLEGEPAATSQDISCADGKEGEAAQRSNARQENIPAMVEGVKSNDPVRELEATQLFRRLLSIEHSPPIQAVLDAGVVPDFVRFLKASDRTELQFEAAWALTNIASGTQEQTKVVIDHGAVPIFVELLISPKDEVREQAVWALGNIAGDSPMCRDLVLQANGLKPLLEQLRDSSKFSMTRNATWTLSNLCRGKPAPPFEWVSPAIEALAGLLNTSDTEVLTDACWALSYLSDGENNRIEAVIDAGVCNRLVELLVHLSPLVQTPALRTVGNIVTGDDRQTQTIIKCGAIPNLLTLLDSPRKGIRKEACWTISNITAGSRAQIQEVMNHGLIPPLIHLLSTAEYDIKKEAAWAISNAASGGDMGQVDKLVELHCIKPLCDLLQLNDNKIITVALEAIENILRIGKQRQKENNLAENPYCALVEQADGVQSIENLQDTGCDEIYQKSWRIIYSFFPYEEENELEEESNSATNFQFGATQPQGGFDFGGTP